MAPYRGLSLEVVLLVALGLAYGAADTNFLTGANDILAVRCQPSLHFVSLYHVTLHHVFFHHVALYHMPRHHASF
jgi:hypothetical protein